MARASSSPAARRDPASPAGSLWAGAPERSSRRMSLSRRLAYTLLAPILSAVMFVLWRSCRVAALELDPAARAALESGEPWIPCVWHQRVFACLDWLLRRAPSRVHLAVLVSPSVDGELVQRTLCRFALRIVRGSATRTGGPAIRELHRVLARERTSVLVAPDGPHGPARRAKAGAVVLAQLSGAPLVPLACAYDRAWSLSSWDRFLVPRPFARVAIVAGRPRRCARDMPAEALEGEVRALEQDLELAVERAETLLSVARRKGTAA